MTKDEFILRITEKERDKRQDLVKLKNETIPLVLYGLGDYGNTVFNFLKDNQITIDFVCVDREFHLEETWNDIPMISTDNLDDTLKDKYNLVIGFSRFKDAERKLRNCNLLSEYYFFDSISFFDFFNRNYILEHSEKFTETYNMLADERSKAVLIAFINGKLQGKPEELYDLVEGNQYFPEDIIRLNSNESFVDAGAYVGDTLSTFLKKVNYVFDTYYAFEPDVKNYIMLEEFVSEASIENIWIYKLGVSNQKAQLRFISNKVNTVKSNISKDGDLIIEVDSIDNVLKGQIVSFIKMDIEGAEYDALNGAQQTIIRYKPKLAVSMYHKPDDLFKIPQYIRELRPDYKFYLKHHMHITQELVLYAI
jgi:FkbM family methyltransferase